MKKKNTHNDDPWPYAGPIARADGVRPFNHHLWALPGDDWWANRSLGDRFDGRWHFAIYALADATFATTGFVPDIEDNADAGLPCVFDCRTKAIRIAAARMIKVARASRKWTGYNTGALKGEKLAMLINWARSVVAAETGKEPQKPISIKPEATPVIIKKTGMPLFDFALGSA